jgi:hypothetical protein
MCSLEVCPQKTERKRKSSIDHKRSDSNRSIVTDRNVGQNLKFKTLIIISILCESS